MHKLSIFFLLVLVGARVHAQDTTVRISPQLTVVMPSPPDSSISGDMRTFKVLDDSAYFMANVSNERLPVGSKREFEAVLKGMGVGFTRKVGVRRALEDRDTVVGGVPGRFAHLITRIDSTEMHMFIFYTVVDGHCHFIQCGSIAPEPSERIRQYFAAARFHGTTYVDRGVAGSIGYFLGRILGLVIVIGVVVGIILLIRHLVTKRRNDQPLQ